MTAVDTQAPQVPPVTVRPAAGRAVTWLAVCQMRRGAGIVILLVAGMSAMVAITYASTVGDALDAAALAALAENPAIRTLFGEPVALNTSGGFTVWRTGTVLAVLVGVWGLLTATRITRGEEDAGRWDLLLAGRIPLTTIVIRHVTTVVAAVLLAGLATAGALIAAGTPPVGAALHGAGVALVGVFFAAAGTVAAQIVPARSAATGAAAALLGAGLLIRMIGDGIDALGWLRWLSPFGLMALSRPYDTNRVLPLVVLALAASALLATIPATTGHRDIRGGWLAPRTGRAPRLALLGSIPVFAVRRLLRPLAGWTAGIGAYYLLIGLLAVSMTDFLADNAQFADLAAQAGFAGLGSVEGYAAAMFGLLAIPVGIFTAVRIAATAADETDRRLTLLYAQPVTRLRLLATEAAVTASGAVILTANAGLATWAGATAVGAPLHLDAALAGAVNVVPVAVLCLGAAIFALGWLPRAVALIGALPAAGGFLLQVIVDSTGAPHWVSQLSPFAHLASVPDVPPDWAGIAGMVGIATVVTIIGAHGYQHRDLRD
ncbi:polyketide antibiotic transporter [Micromonospora acroterricola]|uniref:Polyketide antibiotic transporter n=1 Tax=Micromonospora acroterricola TaxID=2202421 RepID=A0A317D3P1_9ACTN|nr:polyketide antibiotic transporter [Micromonospora acroterricola]PWR07253.1 polyketide antibiotic transporter [Micromonospora acroterricola]